jgi:hypothetical protein
MLNFGRLSSRRYTYIDAINDVRILSCFSNTEGFREEESLGSIAISSLSVLSVKVQPTVRDSVLRSQTMGKGS